MAKASPIQTSFVKGEWSPKVRARVDHQWYRAAYRRGLNGIPIVQGPFMRRSGTAFVHGSVFHNVSRLVEFSSALGDETLIEVGENEAAFWKDAGLVLDGTETGVTGMTVDTANAELDVEVASASGLASGDYVVLTEAPGVVQFRVFKIKSISGSTLTLEYKDAQSVSYSSGGKAKRVYIEALAHSYTPEQLEEVQVAQSIDVMYFFHKDVKTQKFSRFADDDWSIEEINFVNGPFGAINPTPTSLTPADYGNAALGGTYSASSAKANTPASNAFSAGLFQIWRSDNESTGFIKADLGAGNEKVIVAYSMATLAGDSVKEQPITWRFQGSNDDTAWDTLDTRTFTGWGAETLEFFRADNDTAYRYYRLRITTNNGGDDIRILYLGFLERAEDQTPFVVNASSTVGINNDQGFLAGDVGRSVRVRPSDGLYRILTIRSVESTTQVKVTLDGPPFISKSAASVWYLGLYSDVAGWPSCGLFYEDRLWLGGPGPRAAGSRTGDYENHLPADYDGVVADDHAVNLALLSRRLNNVRWLGSEEQALIVGTSDSIWTIQGLDAGRPVVPTQPTRTRPTSTTGVANAPPVQVDNAVLSIPRFQRQVIETAYNAQFGGFRSPDISAFSEHLLERRARRLAWQREPFPIVWVLLGDGTLLSCSYDRDQELVAWSSHELLGGLVEDIAVMSNDAGTEERLWLRVRWDDKEVRTLETITLNRNFEAETLDESWYLDGAIRYQGVATNTVSGLAHFEGESVDALADGFHFSEQVVTDGAISLPGGFEAANILVGRSVSYQLHTLPIEAGAADGTAQGKIKRFSNVSVGLINSVLGHYARDPSAARYDFPSRPYGTDLNEIPEPFTGWTDPIQWPDGYDNDGGLFFTSNRPYPFHVSAIAPQVFTQDR